MSRGEIKLFSKSELNGLTNSIVGLADKSSSIIYIYDFIADKPSRSGGLISGVNDNKASYKSKNKKRSDLISSVVAKVGGEKKKWAIRIEGEAHPLSVNFKSKETALKHAKKLLNQGKGKVIKVSNA